MAPEDVGHSLLIDETSKKNSTATGCSTRRPDQIREKYIIADNG